LLYTDRLYRQIDDPLLRLDSTLARLQSSPWLRDTGQYQQFVDAARSLRKSVADARAGQLFQSDDLYADFARRLAALARTVDDFNAGPNSPHPSFMTTSPACRAKWAPGRTTSARIPGSTWE